MEEPPGLRQRAVPRKAKALLWSLMLFVILVTGFALYAVGWQGPSVTGPVAGPLSDSAGR